MKRIFTHLFVSVLLMLSATSWAQFTNGKVYRIVCSGTTSVSLGATALSDVAAVSTSENDKLQQWYVIVNGSNYTFRNLANGRYLQGNNGTSAEWGLTKESNNFTVTVVNNNYCIRQVGHDNGHGYMHKDGGNNIVSWETSAPNSQWTPVEVSYTSDQLQSIWNTIDALVVPDATVTRYNTALEAIFADKACTQLNSTYASKTVDQIKTDEKYLALPATLQAMVLKVKSGDWSEANAVDGKEGWSHDYAKRFRVQMYEPYSIEGEITSYLRINAHSNMDNPTGIYANANEPIYIMVDGDIADGAELWVAHQAGFGATQYYNNNAHFQLKKGLNVIPYFNDASTLWINYVVHTYNKDGATIAEKFPENRKLSNYKPLKIHIEGGHINGYYNAMGDFRATDSGTENLWGAVDNDEDWNYYKVRAPLNGTDAPNRDFPLLGHRQTLLFPLGQAQNADGGTEQGLLHHLDNIKVVSTPNCYGGSGNTFGTFDGSYPGMGLSTSNGKINIMLEAWDRIMYSELATMGVVSTSTMDKMNALYPRWTSGGTPAEIYDYKNKSNLDNKTYLEFCNGIDYSEYFNHHGCGVGATSGYMSGGWRVCNYHYNTMGSIIGVIAAQAGPTWGPAHEIGHQHQGVFNLNGQTEVTNNFFSNVAVWYMGMGTSRYNGNEGSLESVLAAFNKDDNDLYTNNIWAITHLYYRLWLYYHLAGNNTQFWPRLFELCRQVPLENGGQISGETSLLRFYQHACDAAGEDLTEFFRAHGFFEIMDNRLVGDYSNATYNVTQEQIGAAIATVKAKKYPVNYAVLFINDGTSETTKMHDGTTSRSLWDNNATAEYGSVNDFISGNVAVETNYSAVVNSDGSITMSGGQGGAGFIVLNDKGELVSFSNKSTFTLNEEAKYMLASGKGSVLTVNSESETVEAEIDLTPMQKAMLESFIADVEAMPIDDGSYRHIGFYTKASATDLLAALESAKTILAAGNGGYAAAYEILYTEKEKFLANSANATLVPFDPSLTYTITSYAYGNTMHLNSGVRVSASADKSANTAKWQFKATSTDGVYNIYCLSNYYLTAASKSTLLTVVSEQESAAAYNLTATNRVGAWEITTSQTSTAGYGSLHDDANGKVVGWSNDADASKWCLIAIEGSTNNLATSATDELKALVAKTEALIDVVGVAIPCRLQTTDANAPFYLWCNANVTSGGDASMPANGYNILDGIDNTFLHTVYSGNSADGLHHYLRLDMGEGNSLSKIQFSYKTRHNGDSKSHPKVIKVEGSNDGKSFVEIATISSGLPETYSTVYTSEELTNGNAYRYIRFMVTDTYGTATDGNGHEYFYIAEFDIPALSGVYTKIDPEYTYVQESTVKSAYDAIVAANAAIESNASDYSGVRTVLQEAYDALLTAYNNPVTAKKTELATWIKTTSELIASVGAVEVGNVKLVSLTTNNFYCNAPLASDGGATVNNQYNLADGNSSTYLHTKPNFQGEDDYGYHYLRVDLGENNSAECFKFSYQNRKPSSYKVFPKIMDIQGSTDGDIYESIVEISSGLPDSEGGVYNSSVLGNGKAYRYFRFVVKNTYANNSTPNYFCMSEFVFNTVKDNISVDAEYAEYVSKELLYSTYLVNEESGVIYGLEDRFVTVGILDAQIAALQAAYNALANAIESSWSPVKLTIDENNPVLYTIDAIGRSDSNNSKAWQYNMESNNVTVVNKDVANFYHLWYFMAGNAEHSVKIVPVMTPEHRLDCNDYGNGADKVYAGTDGVEWEFHRTAAGEYNFKPVGQNTYLSNFGGGGNALGFYGNMDGGSKVNFTEVVVKDYASARLNSLASMLEEVTAGDAVGCCTAATGDVYNKAFEDAKSMGVDSAPQDYMDAFATLFDAYRNLEIVMPQSGSEDAPVLYTITNVGRDGGKMFVNGDAEPVMCWGYGTTDAKSVFVFEPAGEKGKFYMKSLERDTYISTAHGHGQGIEKMAAGKDDAKIVTISSMLLGSRAVSITPAGGAMLHADGSGNANKVVAWNNNDVTSASAWLIDEVTDLSQVAHTVKMNASFSSVMLGYNATLPKGVEAYNAVGIEDGYVSLVKIAEEGGVIPANTPVILYRTDNETEKTFTYAAVSASAPEKTVLGGSLYLKYVKCDENKDYYKLMLKDGQAKMYWMYKEFDAAGVSQGETNDGGHIKCSANKIYMALPSQQQIASYGMRFVDGETTGVEDVLSGNADAKPEIYDLTGRKVIKPSSPGIYIVNGKKQFLHPSDKMAF